ncbi:MAG TPA: hypothetical protein DCS93_21240 [Microscillaceae bacterium]|nr:hypothetical protein [Microscillaceae bacterium]
MFRVHHPFIKIMLAKTQASSTDQQVEATTRKQPSQQKNKQFQSSYKTPKGKLDPIQTKQGRKPPIQAKQKSIQRSRKPPIQAKQKSIQRNSDTNVQGIDAPKVDYAKEKYNVDISNYKLIQNSSFPGSIGANGTHTNTSQGGGEIHLSPGASPAIQLHEEGHALDNAIHGIPKADAKIKGQAISTDASREKAADKYGEELAKVPIQNKSNETKRTKESQESPTQKPENHDNQNTFNTSVPSVLQLSDDKEDRMTFGYYGRDGKRKSAKVVTMEEFGDHNRIHNVDPDKIQESLAEDLEIMGIDSRNSEEGGDINKKTGIWRPSEAEGTARPEDALLYQPVRKAYHKAHNVFLYLHKYHMNNETEQSIHSFMERFGIIGDGIKKAGKEYKAKVRDFTSESEIGTLRNEYIAEMQQAEQVVLNLQNDMLIFVKNNNPLFDRINSSDEDIINNAEDKGKHIWREQWHGAVMAVNEILTEEWDIAKPEIEAWAQNKKDEGEQYMRKGYNYKLDYIGSLAKGYKSAAKQYLHFHPEKFDVDSALIAPHLALYVILHEDQKVDRGSVKSKGIEPLEDFEKKTWGKLQQIAGIDLDDPFEVFIRTDGMQEIIGLQGDQKRAQLMDSASARYQIIKDRVWHLRINQGKKYSDMFYKIFSDVFDGGKDFKDHNEEGGININEIGAYLNLYEAMEVKLTEIEHQAAQEGEDMSMSEEAEDYDISEDRDDEYYTVGDGFQENSERWILDAYRDSRNNPTSLSELGHMLMNNYVNVDNRMQKIYNNYLLLIHEALTEEDIREWFGKELERIETFIQQNAFL